MTAIADYVKSASNAETIVAELLGVDWRNVEHIRLAHTVIGYADYPASYEAEFVNRYDPT